MPDCIPATIMIGGKLRKAKLDEFRALLPPDGDLDEAIEKGEAFEGSDGDAAWGDFPELTAFCRKNKLTYRHSADAKYEYNGEVFWWEPGMKDPITSLATQEGRVYITGERLKVLLNQGGTLQDVVDDLERFAKPVPPLQVVGVTRKRKRKEGRT